MKKFGLIIPDSKKKTTAVTVTKPVKKVASIFNDDDFDDNEDEKELVSLRKAKAEQVKGVSKSISSSSEFVEKIHEEALREDPNIFDYDASVESTNSRRNIHRNLRFTDDQPEQREQNKTEPKYMHNILAKAEERKMESELIKLRNMKRKSGAIDKEADEEVFITSAYSQRLKELEEKEKELKARQIREEDGDVTKRKDMSGFYYNLMKRNVSFGGKMRQDEPSVLKNSKEAEETQAVSPVIQITTQESSSESEEEVLSFGPRRPPIKK